MTFLKADKFTTKAVGEIRLPGLDGQVGGGHAAMTVNGTVVRTATLLAVTTVAAGAGWFLLAAYPALALLAMLAAVGGALGFGIWANRRPLNAKVPAFLYAVSQGFLIGGVSGQYNAAYDGIVLQALMITGCVVGVTLALYAAGWIKVTERFRSMVLVATVAVMAYYLLTFALALFGVQAPLIWDSGWLGIGFTLLVLGIAIANLFVDYQVITDAIESGADERFEWFAAFGVAATVLWVYVEVLRLLGRMRNN